MTIVQSDPQTKGRYTKFAHALLVCTALLKLCGLIYIIVGSLLKIRDGVFNTYTFPLLNQFVIHGMPLGDLSWGLVVALYFFLPLHTLFGFLGFFGAICRNKLLLIIHTCLLLFGIALDTVFIVLFSLILEGINTWIKWRFIDFYEDYSSTPTRLNTEVYNAFNHMFDAMDCTVAVGSATAGVGCWDKYYPTMNGHIIVLIFILSISIILEVINIVLTDVIYRSLNKGKHTCSSGMFGHFAVFVAASWRRGKCLFVFTVIQLTDLGISVAMFVGGIVLCRSRFVTDSLLLPVFENLRFSNYYLPDIILGLGVTMILICCFNLVSCGIGLNILCFNSATKHKVHLTCQIILVMILLTVFVFWMSVLGSVWDGMSDQLYPQLMVYGYDKEEIGRTLSSAWNALFVTYSCCGVGDIGSIAGTYFHSNPAYGVSHFGYGVWIPNNCRNGAARSNSDLIMVTNLPATGQTYYTETCDSALSFQIQTYAIVCGVLCGMMLVIKIYNMVHFYTSGFVKLSDTEISEPSESGVSVWNSVKERFRTSPCIILGPVFFVVLSMSLQLGIIIAGCALRFDKIFGHKDIQKFFAYVYIGGKDLVYWTTTLSNFMIGIGTASLVTFSVGIATAAVGTHRVFCWAFGFLSFSVMLKCVMILLWIPLRHSFSMDLDNELEAVMRGSYKTDKPFTSKFNEDRNLGINTLFQQGECCSFDVNFFMALSGTNDFIQTDYPWTCKWCDPALTSVRWYSEGTVKAHCNGRTLHTSKDCISEVRELLRSYDVTAGVFIILLLIFEIMLMIALDRIYKSRVSPEQSRGWFSAIFLNNRFINETSMPDFIYIAFVLCLLMTLSMCFGLLFVVGVILQKFEPGYFFSTEKYFLNHIYSYDISLGYATDALGFLLLCMTLLSMVQNAATFIAVLRKWQSALIGFSVATVVFAIWNLVVLGLLSRILDVAYCCDKSPDCSYRVDIDSPRTFDEMCSTGFHGAVYNVIGAAVAYFVILIVIQVVSLVLLDRLYMRMRKHGRPEEESSGVFTTIWKAMTNNRVINKERMPNFGNLAAISMILKITAMVTEFPVMIGIIVQKFSPAYFYTTENVYLNNIYRGQLPMGYVTHTTGIIMLCVIILSMALNVLGVLAILKRWKTVMFWTLVPGLLLVTTELICIGFLSTVLSVAYCCDTSSSSDCIYHTSSPGPSFDQFCTHGFQGAVYNVIGTFIGFLVAHSIVQVSGFILADRMYKRMDANDVTDKEPHGLFTSTWLALYNNRFVNEKRMPTFRKLAAVSIALKTAALVTEFPVMIGIIVQKFSPAYFYTTENIYLNNIYRGQLPMGYVTHTTGIIMFCVIVLSMALNVLGALAILKRWKTVMFWIWVPGLLLVTTELICMGFLSPVLSVAYCCDTSSSSDCIYHTSSPGPSFDQFCTHGFQSAVYNVIGTFIGFLVAHSIVQVSGFILADRMYKRMDANDVTDKEPHGLFTSTWLALYNNRFVNEERMPTFRKLAAVSIALKTAALVTEFPVMVGIIVEKFSPAYFYTTENVYLNNIYRGQLSMGYVTHTTGIIMFCVIVLSMALNVLGVLAILKRWKTVMFWTFVPGLLLVTTELICMGFLSPVLSVAYCCDTSSSSDCLYHTSSPGPTLDKLCTHGFQGAVYNVIGTFVCFLAVHSIAQVSGFILADRMYKRMDANDVTDKEPHGLLTTTWLALYDNRFVNEERMPNFRKLAAIFIALKIATMLTEFPVMIGIIVQKFSPAYFYTTENVYLNNIYRGQLSMGYVTHTTGIIMFCVVVLSMALNVLGVLAILKRWKTVMLWAVGPSLLLVTTELIGIGFLSPVLSVAYCCDTPSSSDCLYHTSSPGPNLDQFCTHGFQSAVYNVIGTFIGFLILHCIAQVGGFLLLDRIYKRMDANDTTEKEPHGLFAVAWLALYNNRFVNEERMPTFRKRAAVYIALQIAIIVTEFPVMVGIIVEKFSPAYFYTTENVYLNNIYRGQLSMGYVTHTTGIIMFCVIVLSMALNVLGVLAILKRWKTVMFWVVGPSLLLVTTKLICMGFLSPVWSVASCCDKSTLSDCTFHTSPTEPSLDEFCTHGFQDAVRNVIGTFVCFLAVNSIAQVAGFILADRMYKRMDAIEVPDKEPHGLFTTMWLALYDNRFVNEDRMPKFRKLAAVCIALQIAAMVTEFPVMIGIIVQKFSPAYFYTTENVYLNNIYRGQLSMGYVTHTTGIIMFCVIVLSMALNVLGVLAILKRWKTVMFWTMVPCVLIIATECVCLGLLSVVLSVAYCCDTPSSSDCLYHTSSPGPTFDDLCKEGFQEAVYNVIGTFIAFIVVAIIAQITTLILSDRMYKHMDTTDGEPRGLFTTVWQSVRDTRMFKDAGDNYSKVLGFCLLSMFVMMLELATWIAIWIYVLDGDTQVDSLYTGTLYMGQMTRGATITLLTTIPIALLLNILTVVWVIKKWNAGLQWSTLPGLILGLMDTVLLILYAILLDAIRMSEKNIYEVMYLIILSYLSVHSALQIILFIIKDRLHKGIETAVSMSNPAGVLSTFWRQLSNHRFFTEAGGNRWPTLGFCLVSVFLMVTEIVMWIAVWLEGVAPGYLQGDFLEGLNTLSGETDSGIFYNYGDLLWGLIVALLTMELVYIILHIFSVVAVIKQSRMYIHVASVMLGMMFIGDVTTTGLAGELLSMAYNCASVASTQASREFCSDPVSKLFEICGVFIGFTAIHCVLVAVLLGLCLFLAITSLEKATVVPLIDGHVELVHTPTERTITQPPPVLSSSTTSRDESLIETIDGDI